MYHGERLFTALVVLLALTAGWVPASAAVTLEYWIWDQNQLTATKEAIARFEAQHDIKVEVLLVPFPEFFTKVTLGLVSGTGPDVFWMTMYDFGSFHSNNMLLNLQPYIDADPEAAAYMDAIWPVLRDFYAPGGQAYGFPRDFDTIALVYNVNAMQEAGLVEPAIIENIWTWDDLATYSQKLTQRTADEVIRWGYSTGGWGQLYWYPHLSANGGSVFSADGTRATLDSKEAIETIQFLHDLRHVYQGAPNELIEDFPSGRVAMLNQGSWHLKFLSENTDFTFDVAALPRSPHTMQQGSTVHGLANVINPMSKDVEAAFAFVKFLASEEANRILGETGTVIPARIDAARAFFEQSDYPANRIAFLNAVEYADPHPATPYLSTAEWQGIANTYVDQALLGNMPVEQALAMATQIINANLTQAIGQ